MASRLQAVGELQAQLDISLLFWTQTEKLLGAPGLPTFGCEFLAFTFPHGRTPSGADGKSQVLLWASLRISWQRPPQSRSHQRISVDAIYHSPVARHVIDSTER